jgi:cell division protein ZipA
MELSVRDWLIVIGALLIVGVLLDAYRRYRSERRNPIRMSRSIFGMGGGFARDEAELPNSELPSGTARVKPRADAAGEATEIPAAPRAERVEPSLGQDEPAGAAAEPEVVAAAETPILATRGDAPQATASGAATTAATELQSEESAEQVYVIHVLAQDPGGFRGSELLQILLACDVRFGEMNIFHRYEREKGQGEIQFSVANATEPGSFDLDAMETLTTPGLSFFMRLPGPKHPLQAFDCMVETARVVVNNLGGEMRDETRSVFTPQTAEHCRQRIREFAHRSRARR